ncbi:MAG: branched-chain amino acid ABC transporter permease [Alphaproteobacteria bacterium]|jgi:branched-chain amino acid transport system permease protein|nr:branched-chain amino acid ABC transporter permease [SAR116 cluster bacterium]MBT3655065.1 branched-chain amino acid ABC transporter permease [Alphaproteobacteria bacterium]MBT4847713.1 branched-chain amino acid ABC transporter permease [Alphaproteobacteria bacterium]MBT5257138.1 branched-chain amino acid ABC transporter permease [Alphaproteobacteria bacterium]MBT5482339.1 branched-chain amino acid ABC transporter permease [Alphaproteobacteria bacterium]
MMEQYRTPLMFAMMAALLAIVGIFQSWNVALTIVNLCLISSIMTLGVNIQWGYAGLVNFGMMGFTALGGLAAVLIAMPPVPEAWAAGGSGVMAGLVIIIATAIVSLLIWKQLKGRGAKRYWLTALSIVIGVVIMRLVADPSIAAIESVESARTGYLGGFGLPVTLSWIAGGFVAAGAAFVIGRISLGLRSDYLAIATLGISEIVIYVLKNEDWLARGVKNINGLPRPVPYEIELQASQWVVQLADMLGASVVDVSTITVKLSYAGLFTIVLLIFLWLSEVALRSPWGRMMRAIRDNEVAANAMGKHVTARHLQVFILGSAMVGVAGAMLTTLDGQFTPASYQPLRFTFLIWVMVIVGGSGNNFGSVLGGFIVWFFWIESEPLGLWFISTITAGLADGSALKTQLVENAAHMRLMTMGIILLVMLRFAPQGLLPEQKR